MGSPGGYGFWSPTSNPRAHDAFLRRFREQGQRLRGRRPGTLARLARALRTAWRRVRR